MVHLLQTAGLISTDVVCSGEYGDDAIVRVINEDFAVVENVDVFTPIHDDPYIQGRIVACNATNDVFAMGVTKILSLQAFLAYPKELPENIVADVLRGMCDFMEQLDSSVTGGQTIRNPVPVFGGICLGLGQTKDVVYSNGAQVGDSVLLTKPLGIQPAMKSYRDLKDDHRKALLEMFDEPDLIDIQESAVRIMTQSNLEVAQAMNEIGVHAATDVTGFGILGHAGNVAALSSVDIMIDRLPVISGSVELAEFFGHKLSQGFGAETAGGMLVFLEPEKVDDFSQLLAKKGLPCWPIGYVQPSKAIPSARLAEDVKLIETNFP